MKVTRFIRLRILEKELTAPRPLRHLQPSRFSASGFLKRNSLRPCFRRLTTSQIRRLRILEKELTAPGLFQPGAQKLSIRLRILEKELTAPGTKFIEHDNIGYPPQDS